MYEALGRSCEYAASSSAIIVLMHLYLSSSAPPPTSTCRSLRFLDAFKLFSDVLDSLQQRLRLIILYFG